MLLCAAKYVLTIDSQPCTQKGPAPFPCIFPLFLQFFNKYLLSTYYEAETNLFAEDTLVKKREKVSHLHGIYILISGK